MRSQNGSISNGVKSRSTFKQIPKFTHQSILGNKSELADNGPISQLSDEGNPKVARVWPPTDDNLRIFDVVVLADVHHRRRKRVARMIGGITVFGEENGSKKTTRTHLHHFGQDLLNQFTSRSHYKTGWELAVGLELRKHKETLFIRMDYEFCSRKSFLSMQTHRCGKDCLPNGKSSWS